MTVDLNNPREVGDWCDRLRHELLNDVMPFWLNYGLDHVHGGILTALDRDGAVVDSDKSIWAQGRWAWITGKLFNHVEPRQQWKDAGIAAIEFLDRFGFDPVDGRMWFQVTRDGQPVRKRRYGFSESFAAIGYAQWARATGRRDWEQRARNCLKQFIDHGRHGDKYTAARPLHSIGLPMITLATARQLSQSIGLGEARAIMDRCIREIKNDFCKPDIQCVMETTGPHGQQLGDFEGRTLNPGHAIEAAWFVMREGEIRGDRNLIHLGLQMLDWMWRAAGMRSTGGCSVLCPSTTGRSRNTAMT